MTITDLVELAIPFTMNAIPPPPPPPPPPDGGGSSGVTVNFGADVGRGYSVNTGLYGPVVVFIP